MVHVHDVGAVHALDKKLARNGHTRPPSACQGKSAGGHGKSKKLYTNLIVKMDRLPGPPVAARARRASGRRRPPRLAAAARAPGGPELPPAQPRGKRGPRWPARGPLALSLAGRGAAPAAAGGGGAAPRACLAASSLAALPRGLPPLLGAQPEGRRGGRPRAPRARGRQAPRRPARLAAARSQGGGGGGGCGEGPGGGRSARPPEASPSAGRRRRGAAAGGGPRGRREQPLSSGQLQVEQRSSNNVSKRHWAVLRREVDALTFTQRCLKVMVTKGPPTASTRVIATSRNLRVARVFRAMALNGRKRRRRLLLAHYNTL